MKRPGFTLAAALLLLFAAMELKGVLLPTGGYGPAPGGTFDTGFAMARLQRILGDQRPHPVDSAANDALRDRLIAELRTIGLDPQVHEAMACNGHGDNRGVACARVRNVLATIGPAQGRHVLLVSHYDSTPVGPGAADDGIGVATMLETAAVLKNRPMARPVTFLFDEGEEAGLLGARAFLEHDPLAASVDTVANFESRGVTGPAIMFETSRPNAAAVSRFARAARQPVANSMTADFLQLIPNSTDVTVFAERPWTILNFAVIGNETRYHSPGDTMAALDPRSVRHMGEQAVALTQELANGGPTPAGGERIYADVLGRGFVSMPLMLGLLMLTLLILAALWLAWRRRNGLGRAVGATAAALLGSAALAYLGEFAVGLARHGIFWRAHPEMSGAAVDLSALAACTAALWWIGRPSARERLRIGFWLVFLLLGAGLSFLAPGASIFFLAPPAVALAGMAASMRWPQLETPAAITAAALLFLTWAPLLHLIEILLDFPAGWTFAPVASLILFPFLVELKSLLNGGFDRRAPLAPLTAAVLAWIAVGIAPAYSANRKQALGIEYAWSHPEHRGRWFLVGDVSRLPAALASAGQFRTGVDAPWSSRRHVAADAPSLPVPPPRLERLSERPAGTGRLLTLRLSTSGAEQVILRAEPDAQLLAVRAGGSTRAFGAGGKGQPYGLRCHGRSCDGLIFDLLTGSRAPLDLTLSGIRNGLPAAAAPLVKGRPANAAPQYNPDATIAVDKVRV